MQQSAVELGDGLMSLRGERGESIEDYVSARAAAIRIGEFVNLVIGALTKKE